MTCEDLFKRESGLLKSEPSAGRMGRPDLQGTQSEVKRLAHGGHFVTVSCGRLFSPVGLANVM